MCGRFVSTQTPQEIADYFGASFETVTGTDDDAGGATATPPANYNVAPTNDILAVVADGGSRAVRHFQWGLVPLWAKDVKIGSSMINARAETIAEKPAFKGVFRKYRCIIPMDGFYEWQAAGENSPVNAKGKPIKQPMFIHRKDGEPLAVAGIWSAWRSKEADPEAPWLHTCAVITTSANTTMSAVHDRMPVILPASRWDAWLDPATDDVAALTEMLVPAPDELLTMHKVSTDVNNVRNKGPELIAEVDGIGGRLELGTFEAGQLPFDS